jgi:hypothetical protein
MASLTLVTVEHDALSCAFKALKGPEIPIEEVRRQFPLIGVCNSGVALMSEARTEVVRDVGEGEVKVLRRSRCGNEEKRIGTRVRHAQSQLRRGPRRSSFDVWQSVSSSWLFRQQQLADRHSTFVLEFPLLPPK